MKVERQISLEILRILCMLFIVTGHLSGRGNIPQAVVIAPHAVNCFVLISGYFLVTSKFKAERVLRVILETIFYSFSITIILYILGKASTQDIAKSIMPFAPTKFSYWFVNKYLAVILLSPFICKLCTTISKRQYQILLATLLLIGSSLLIVFPFGELFGNGFSLLWMITVFITGGYLRLYAPNFKYWGIATLIFLLLYNICAIYGLGKICLEYNSLITYALGICTFMWFCRLPIPSTGIIAKTTTFIAPYVFAAYLIHEQGLMRTYIVDILTKFSGYIPDTLYLYLFGIAVIILSTIIDRVRILLFKYTGIDYLTNKIASRLNRIYEE
ncbi:MAG: acyltransferase family protein [Bacteroidaceae bacterium]|nr:acyltransferase family protein [Bacteroidaceae bacterium]